MRSAIASRQARPGSRPAGTGRRERASPALVHLADHVPGGHLSLVEEDLVERCVAVHLAERPDVHAGLLHG